MSKPAHKIHLGVLAVTIWKNSSDKGHRYNVTPSRSYQKDEKWQQTASFGFDDLLTMAKLFDQAHTWIARQQAADQKAPKASDEANNADE